MKNFYSIQFVFILILTSVKAKMIKKLILHADNECHAPNSYKIVEKNVTKECQKMEIKNYFQKDFDHTKLRECLDPYIYMDLNGIPKLTNYCNRKNRVLDIYSYKGMALSNSSDSLYLDSAKFDGKLILKENEYKYVRGINPQGFMVATSSPIGNTEDITEDENLNKYCGGPNGFIKIPGSNKNCFKYNPKNPDGKYKQENTILSFYKNLKKYKIKYVIMLSDILIIPENDKNCRCKLGTDKYFPLSNETFRIKNPNHIDESNYSVIGKENNEILKPIFDKDENAYNYLEARELTLKNRNETDYKFNHIHFKHWPDHELPDGEEKEVLLNLIKFVKNKLDNKENVLVHCNAGVGRTGAFIASVLTSGLDSSKIFNFFEFIIELRKHRPKFSRRVKQFKFVMKNMEYSKIK